MRSVVYAIPGLMPPTAPNFVTRIDAPEDGSLLMMIHAGVIDDEVSYSIRVRGCRAGVIKDPKYNFYGVGDMTPIQRPRYMFSKPLDTSKWPDFSLELNDNSTDEEFIKFDKAIIPFVVCNGSPISILDILDNKVEAGLVDPADACIWIIDLPVRTLPVGESEVEVTINGEVRKYIVSRPAFSIHRRPDLTPNYEFSGDLSKYVKLIVFFHGMGEATSYAEFDVTELVKHFPDIDWKSQYFTVYFRYEDGRYDGLWGYNKIQENLSGQFKLYINFTPTGPDPHLWTLYWLPDTTTPPPGVDQAPPADASRIELSSGRTEHGFNYPETT